MNPPDIEKDIKEIGSEIYASIKDEALSLFDRKMKDEGFKTQLFRFADVLPSLKEDLGISSEKQRNLRHLLHWIWNTIIIRILPLPHLKASWKR